MESWRCFFSILTQTTLISGSTAKSRGGNLGDGNGKIHIHIFNQTNVLTINTQNFIMLLYNQSGSDNSEHKTFYTERKSLKIERKGARNICIGPWNRLNQLCQKLTAGAIKG